MAPSTNDIASGITITRGTVQDTARLRSTVLEWWTPAVPADERNAEHAIARAASGAVIGCVSFSTNGETTTFWGHAVHPDYQRHGIGSQLLDSIVTDWKTSFLLAQAHEGTLGYYEGRGFTADPVGFISPVDGRRTMPMSLEVTW